MACHESPPSGAINLAARRAEIDAAGVERVHSHGVAEDVHVAVLLRQALGERFPVVATGFAAIDSQFAVGQVVQGIAGDGTT